MKKPPKVHTFDFVLTVLILAASFGISLLFQRFEVSEQIKKEQTELLFFACY